MLERTPRKLLNCEPAGTRKSCSGGFAGVQLFALRSTWQKHLDDETTVRFQRELATFGYRFQFITLAGTW